MKVGGNAVSGDNSVNKNKEYIDNHPLGSMFKLAFENAPIAMTLIDLKGNYVLVNQSFAQMLGYNIGELIQKNYMDITHPDDLPKNKNWLGDILEGKDKKNHYKLQKRYLDKKGDIVCVEVVARLIRDENGKPLYFNTQVSDISPIKEQDELIRFQIRALSQVHDAVIAMDNYNKIIYWNNGAEELYQVKLNDALGQNVNNLFTYQWCHPEDEWDYQLLLEKYGQWRGENIHITSSGLKLIVESTINILENEHKEKVGVLAVIRDITQRKKIEIELQKSEKNYRNILELARTGVIFMDNKGKIEYINNHFAQLLGYKKKNLLGSNFLELLDFNQQDKCIGYLRHVKNDFKGSVELSFKVKRDLIRHFMLSLNAVIDAQGHHVGYIGILMDISSRKKVEKSLVEAVKERDEVLQFYLNNMHGVLKQIFNKDLKESPHLEDRLT